MPLNTLTVRHTTRTRKLVGASGLILSHARKRAIPNVWIINTLKTDSAVLPASHRVVPKLRAVRADEELPWPSIIRRRRRVKGAQIRNRSVIDRRVWSLLVAPIGDCTIKARRQGVTNELSIRQRRRRRSVRTLEHQRNRFPTNPYQASGPHLR